MPRTDEGKKIIATNRKARHEFHISETYEAGISLVGSEVKSLRMGKANIQNAYAALDNGEVILYDMHISPYEKSSYFNHDPLRNRKLLLNKKEIRKITIKLAERGFTLIPLSVYFVHGLAKIEIGLAKGKKLYDKREDIKRRSEQKEIDLALKKAKYR